MILLVMVLASQTVRADNIVITSDNFTDFFYYDSEFDMQIGGSSTTLVSNVGGYFLKENVAVGLTLDFKGDFLPPTDGSNPRVFINKRVNITSTDKSAVFKSGDTGLYWCFGVVEGGDYAEIKNLQFDNCWVFIHCASYVTYDGIDMKVHDANIGAGVGAFSISTNKPDGHLTDHATVKNSNFYFTNNGSSACIVTGCGGSYATIDNNTIEVGTNAGNMLYSSPYNAYGGQPEFVTYSNNVVTREGAATSVSWGIIICGQGNVVENNTVNYSGAAITTAYGSSLPEDSSPNIYRNNTITGGGSMSVSPYSDVENNHVSGTLTINREATASCNTATKLVMSGYEAIVTDNTVYGDVTFNSAANNTTFTGNLVNSSLTIKGNSKTNTITGNAIFSSGEYAINSDKASTGNRIEYNVLAGAEKQGDEAVNPSIGTDNTIQNNYTEATVITDETTTLTATDNGAFYIVPANTDVTINGNLSVTGSDGQRVNIILSEGATLTINGKLDASGKTVGIYATTNDETTGSMTMNAFKYHELYVSSGIVIVDGVAYNTGHYEGSEEITYSIDMASEYKNVPTVYAGCQNYFTLKVENTSTLDASNVHASVYNDGVLVWEGTIDNLPAGETKDLDVVDPTIRPVTENTVIGNNNENTAYKVVIEDSEGSGEEAEFPFVILYNGNLGKDYAYPALNPTLRDFSFDGDVLILTGTEYSSGSATSHEDAFTVGLDGGNVHKALLYVSYNWDKVDGDFNSWTTTFNGNTIAPLANYRDQGNLGTYGRYGYGLVVYDVTDYVADGSNTFAFQKTAGNVQVYPSSLIVMVENSSGKTQNVYIVEEADMLSRQFNQHVDAIYPSAFEGVAEGETATLYVFAASAQSGEGDLEINGNLQTNVWNGTSNTVEVYETPVDAGDISIQFKATGSTILALHQMVVVSQASSGIVSTDNGQATIDQCFDLQGRRINKPQKGVSIIRTSDGKTRKVLVK